MWITTSRSSVRTSKHQMVFRLWQPRHRHQLTYNVMKTLSLPLSGCLIHVHLPILCLIKWLHQLLWTMTSRVFILILASDFVTNVFTMLVVQKTILVMFSLNICTLICKKLKIKYVKPTYCSWLVFFCCMYSCR